MSHSSSEACCCGTIPIESGATIIGWIQIVFGGLGVVFSLLAITSTVTINSNVVTVWPLSVVQALYALMVMLAGYAVIRGVRERKPALLIPSICLKIITIILISAGTAASTVAIIILGASWELSALAIPVLCIVIVSLGLISVFIPAWFLTVLVNCRKHLEALLENDQIGNQV
uniref:G_PROTEIN_RECEP_F3_4 domain-containing protein n=1 Tax=Steinernema glaseri TaxID=37863 RepID=A0A1I7Z5P4_9BILA